LTLFRILLKERDVKAFETLTQCIITHKLFYVKFVKNQIAMRYFTFDKAMEHICRI